MNRCGIIIPRQREVVGDREDCYLAVCILLEKHSGHHVFETPEGECFGWEYDEDCECCCTEDTGDSCYLYWPISKNRE